MAVSKIKIDLDDYESFMVFDKRWEAVSRITGLTGDFTISPSRSYMHFHVNLTVNEELKPMEVCCLQAILGSDFLRESFNFRRIRRGQKNWNMLFEGETDGKC